MPHAPSPRPTSVLFALTLSALLAASGLPPRAASASPHAAATNAVAAAAACPFTPPPVPLRMLYQESERIVVAKAGASVGFAGEGRENVRRTTFAVAESLKGDPGEKSLPVYHWLAPDNPEYPSNFREGETLLLFLRRAADEEEYGYEVVDVLRGAKRLGEDELKIYLKRIDELGWLMRLGAPAPDELAEWLVRCVEEPATRWEGAYELGVSRQLAHAEAEAKREAAGEKTDDADEEEADETEEANDAEGEDEPVPDESSDAETGGEEETGDAAGEAGAGGPSADGADEVVATDPVLLETPEGFAGSDISLQRRAFLGTDIGPDVFTQLVPEQKERIASALYGADKLGEGELRLVPLIESWDDGRLAPFLVKHLSKLAADPPYEVEELMQTLASLLKDRRLRKLAEKYSEEAPYGEIVEDEEESEDGAAAAARATNSNAPDAEPRQTSTQVRAAMLRAFLAAVEDRLNRMSAETAQRQ